MKLCTKLGMVSGAFVACLVAAGCDSAPLQMGMPGTMTTTTTPPPEMGGVVVASGQEAPVALAVDGVNVYWENMGTNATVSAKAPMGWVGGQILECAAAGCDAPVALASNLGQFGGQGVPAVFATDGESVYWDDDSRSALVKCAVGGCAGQPQVIGPQGVQSLTVFQGTLYWTKFAAELYACPAAGCGSSETTLWSAGNTPCNVGVAVDASGIYWVADATPTVFSCPLAGCGGTPTSLMAGSDTVADVQQIAIDANNVYFTDGNPDPLGMVLACPKSGCGASPTVLASGLGAPVAIATDGINVYWTEMGPNYAGSTPVAGAGLVRKCAVGGCANAPTDIATGLTAPGAIALDDANVYWTENGTGPATGKIWKAPK